MDFKGYRNRNEQRKARRLKDVLDWPYTKALRVLRSNDELVLDWQTVTDEELQNLFQHLK